MNRFQLRQLREQVSAMIPPPEPAKKPPPPPWFERWVRALVAEMCAQARWSRDCAKSYDNDMFTLHGLFHSAHYLFCRNFGREPLLEEWRRWLSIAEEVAQRPDTEEALNKQKGWLLYHAKKWREERQAKPCAN
jgi:hypothetical protein